MDTEQIRIKYWYLECSFVHLLYRAGALEMLINHLSLYKADITTPQEI